MTALVRFFGVISILIGIAGALASLFVSTRLPGVSSIEMIYWCGASICLGAVLFCLAMIVEKLDMIREALEKSASR